MKMSKRAKSPVGMNSTQCLRAYGISLKSNAKTPYCAKPAKLQPMSTACVQNRGSIRQRPSNSARLLPGKFLTIYVAKGKSSTHVAEQHHPGASRNTGPHTCTGFDKQGAVDARESA